MKPESAYVLLAFLSTSALCGFSSVPSDAGRTSIEVPEATPIAAHSPPLDTRVGAVALDAFSDSPAPETSRSDNRPAETLATYLFFHKTWSESLSTQATARYCAE